MLARPLWLSLIAGSYVALLSNAAHAADGLEPRGCWGNAFELAEASTHPVNGDLLAFQFTGGCDDSVLQDVISATVDGQAATLTLAEPLRGNQDTVPIRIEPAPEVGQTIAIFQWGSEALSLEVVEADEDPPTVPVVALDADYGMTDLWDDSERWMFMVDVFITEPSVDASAVRYEVELSADGVLVDKLAVLDRPSPEYGDFRDVYTPTPAGNPFHGANRICVDVQAIDAAGNPTQYARDCIDGIPFREAPGQGADPPAPIDDGGACPESECDGGLSCAVAGPSPTGALAWLLPILLVTRRARAARSSRPGPCDSPA